MKLELMVSTVAIALVLAFFGLIPVGHETSPLSLTSNTKGAVDKAQGQNFTVIITFENTGKTAGSWNISVTFEGDMWIWTASPQSLTLNAGQSRALTWKGTIPDNAPIDTMARLVAYYNDESKALDWWIRIVPDARLTITGTMVR